MAEFRLIPVAAVVPPPKPMRTETLYEGLDLLKESMQEHGLEQPIGVTECEDGTFELRWGMRRTLAARELGWTEMMARVFQPGEGNALMEMAHENLQRADLNPIEEAEFYAGLQKEFGISQAEVARRCRKSASHVGRLVNLLGGDVEVARALRDGKINTAQAVEINRFGDDIGRAQALAYSVNNGMTAGFLARWREEREKMGIDVSVAEVTKALREMPQIDYRTHVKCAMHGQWVLIQEAPLRAICEECWTMMGQVLEWYSTHAKELPEGHKTGRPGEAQS